MTATITAPERTARVHWGDYVTLTTAYDFGTSWDGWYVGGRQYAIAPGTRLHVLRVDPDYPTRIAVWYLSPAGKPFYAWLSAGAYRV